MVWKIIFTLRIQKQILRQRSACLSPMCSSVRLWFREGCAEFLNTRHSDYNNIRGTSQAYPWLLLFYFDFKFDRSINSHRRYRCYRNCVSW